MKRNLFLQLIICLLLFGTITAASAAPIPSQEAALWAETRGNALLKAFSEPDLEKKYQTLDKMLLDYVDLEYISRFVIGKYWRQMTPAQKAKYQALFKRYALALYKGFPLSFGENLKFRIGRVFPEQNYTTVRTIISLPRQSAENQTEITVEFLLSQKQKQIKIIDLKLGESSLILSYRSRFYEMVSQADDDMEWFLEDFEMITLSSEKSNELKLQKQNR